MSKLQQYPTPFAGISLGVAGISLFWASFSSSPLGMHIILIIGFILAGSLLLPVIGKFLRHPNLLWDDLKHPTVGSVVPTMAMSLMLLSHSLGLCYLPLGVALWAFAVMLHVIFFSVFTYHQFRKFDLNHIVPSWFVPPIGIVVATLVTPIPELLPVSYILVTFGIVSYAFLLPLVLYRLALGEKIENARKPTLAILAAPASLCLAGYLTITHTPSPLLVLFLLSIAILMTISVYMMLSHLLRLAFSPAYAAFTFPLAISATAMFKFSVWASTQAMFQHAAGYFQAAALIEAVLATSVITYVVLHAIYFLFAAHLFQKLLSRRVVKHR